MLVFGKSEFKFWMLRLGKESNKILFINYECVDW